MKGIPMLTYLKVEWHDLPDISDSKKFSLILHYKSDKVIGYKAVFAPLLFLLKMVIPGQYKNQTIRKYVSEHYISRGHICEYFSKNLKAIYFQEEEEEEEEGSSKDFYNLMKDRKDFVKILYKAASNNWFLNTYGIHPDNVDKEDLIMDDNGEYKYDSYGSHDDEDYDEYDFYACNEFYNE